MEPQLLQIKDIHLPAAISWWPFALGWWMALGLLLLMVIAWRYRHQIRTWFAPSVRSIALLQLDEIVREDHLSTQQKVRRVSQLLRQSAISHGLRDQAAGLTGEQWLQFLDDDNPQKPFSTGIGRSLIDAPYRPHAELDIDALVELTRSWLKQNLKHFSNKAERL